MEVKKRAKIRDLFIQVPQLTRDTIRESDKNTRKHHTQESQEVSPFHPGDHCFARNRKASMIKTNMEHKRKRSIALEVSVKIMEGLNMLRVPLMYRS